MCAQAHSSKGERVNQKHWSFSGSYSILVPRQFLTFQPSRIKLFPQVIISRVINHTYAYRARGRVCLCMPGYMNVCADRNGGRWKIKDNSDSVVIWKMTGYFYNLAVTWQPPSLWVNLVQTLQDADSYLCCSAVTACPRVWRTGWRAEGCGETECDHNWGCCLSPLRHNLKREKHEKQRKVKKDLIWSLAKSQASDQLSESPW